MTSATAAPPGTTHVLKHCARCKITKPIEQFSRNRVEKDGHQRWCGDCRRAHYKLNGARYRERKRQRRRSDPAVRAGERRWRAKNPDAAKAMARRSYERHREARIAKVRERQQRIAAERRAERQAEQARLDAAGVKVCTLCGGERPRAEFYASKNASGLSSWCRPCTVERNRAWAEANPERAAAVKRDWEARDPDRATASKRRAKDRRRAREAGQFVEDVAPLVVLELDDGVCGICGDDVDPFRFEVDHKIPICRGGAHAYFNVQVAHPSCNRGKARRLPEAL